MKKNNIHLYKEAIKAKYEEAKLGDYCGFLINPSPAKLRELCILLLNENKNSEDLMSFKFFFGFEFKPENNKKLKSQTEKFKPLGSFLRGETELANVYGMDIVAILIGFESRPLKNFIKMTNFDNKPQSK